METQQRRAGTGRSVWVEEPVGRPRLPDPVRTSAVRAGLIAAVTLVEVIITILGALGGSWLTAPAFLGTVVSTIAGTWAVLDVFVSRQAWEQRNGVVSTPSSVARRRRRRRPRRRRAPEQRVSRRSDALSRA